MSDCGGCLHHRMVDRTDFHPPGVYYFCSHVYCFEDRRTQRTRRPVGFLPTVPDWCPLTRPSKDAQP